MPIDKPGEMTAEEILAAFDPVRIKGQVLFGELFDDLSITEIAVNKLGEVWFEDDKGWTKGTEEQCQRVTKEAFDDYVITLGNYVDQRIEDSNPILSATMPTGERVQVVVPPACDVNQRLITIRKPSTREITLEDFRDSGFFDEIVIGEYIDPVDVELTKALDEKDYFSFFKLAVMSGTKNLVIAGATGSGKTTFMKALVYKIPEQERLISIEDVRELDSKMHENFLHLLYPSEGAGDITPARLLKSCLRMKPDRILLAELRGGESFDYINVISSGHGGSITSVHAGSRKEVIRRITLMSMQNETGSKIPYETTQSIIEETIDIIVHITNHGGKRRISTIFWKDYDKLGSDDGKN